MIDEIIIFVLRINTAAIQSVLVGDITKAIISSALVGDITKRDRCIVVPCSKDSASLAGDFMYVCKISEGSKRERETEGEEKRKREKEERERKRRQRDGGRGRRTRQFFHKRISGIQNLILCLQY